MRTYVETLPRFPHRILIYLFVCRLHTNIKRFCSLAICMKLMCNKYDTRSEILTKVRNYLFWSLLVILKCKIENNSLNVLYRVHV